MSYQDNLISVKFVEEPSANPYSADDEDKD